MSRLPLEEAQWLARGNQRITVRYRCAPATTGKLFVAEDHAYVRAWIVNISKTGIGVTLAHPVSAGTLVVLQLRGAAGLRELPSHVVHATRMSQTEWLIGCELIKPLTDDELDALL